ncbi:MAG: hypothetical protein BGP12_08515 [Rhodospirillales bacterium 70-18]|nr:PRC-barrel domain-containing protein [Rhodospirillales bacterium]OJY73141.1 MAG: hypothetical protein BGP12_08515 [Rhodospirillales bacterium 70-18]
MKRVLLVAALAAGLGASPPPVPPTPDAPAEIAAPTEVAGLLGYRVHDDTGKELGRIVDVLVDAEGRVRGVVVDVGGFLGVGSRKVAIAWRALTFSSGKDGLVVAVAVTTARIRLAPEVLPGKPIVMLDVPTPGLSR